MAATSHRSRCVDAAAHTRAPPFSLSSFDKITARVSKLCYGLDKQFVEPVE